LTPVFSAERTVREYTEKYYLKAAAAYHLRSADQGAAGVKIINWQHDINQKWRSLRLDEVKVETHGGQYLFESKVYLDDLDPKAVRIELYADNDIDGSFVGQEMNCIGVSDRDTGSYIYRVAVSAARPPEDYTIRVIPYCDGVAVPLENAHILWQK
jgi:glycogen phosphorylase